MAVITGNYYTNWPRSKNSSMARGHEVLCAATSASHHATKDGRATDSCFTLIVAHQCGILMFNSG